MPEPRKSYVGFIEHDELSFKPRAFVNFLAGYLGWGVAEALDVQFVQDHEFAAIKLSRAYGQPSLDLLLTASDSGTYPGYGGRLFQRVALSVTFDDPNNWHDAASEQLVARTMRELDEAIEKLTTYQRIWRWTTGYWRCGVVLYECPSLKG